MLEWTEWRSTSKEQQYLLDDSILWNPKILLWLSYPVKNACSLYPCWLESLTSILQSLISTECSVHLTPFNPINLSLCESIPCKKILIYINMYFRFHWPNLAQKITIPTKSDNFWFETQSDRVFSNRTVVNNIPTVTSAILPGFTSSQQIMSDHLHLQTR